MEIGGVRVTYSWLKLFDDDFLYPTYYKILLLRHLALLKRLPGRTAPP